MSSVRYQETLRVKNSLVDALEALQDLTMSTQNWKKMLPDVNMSDAKSTALT